MSRMCQLVLLAGTGELTIIKNKFAHYAFRSISQLQQLDSQLVHDMSEIGVILWRLGLIHWLS